ncbi:uncharacterized protein DEA37_0002314 [Paragonimus westermani]|uniref:Uncharacterized protein n=1 Tax=Paragonimus westermani TaxID=34504 RepID=A0A5J4NDS1_9TREM|nr:uncharacterized protein DEA37_0002314 [Paragonimus westermani]
MCGLGQRKRHKHPAELNAERLAVLPRQKDEWSDYSIQKLVNLANAMVSLLSFKSVLYQRLASKFAGRRNDAAKSALDGPWASAYKREVTLPMRMRECWKEILETENKPGLRPLVIDKYEWNVLAAVSFRETQKALHDSTGMAPGIDWFRTGDFLKWKLEAVAQLLNLMLLLESPT